MDDLGVAQTVDDVILDFEEELEIQQQISDAMVPKDLPISEDEEEVLEAELAALMQQPGQSGEKKQETIATPKQVELPSVAGLASPTVAARQEREEKEPERTSPAAVHA
jgi:hypothetical protein